MDKLDDLEITKLCAEAMGYAVCGTAGTTALVLMVEIPKHPMLPVYAEQYDPLHDDAQCMALVKKFQLVLAQAQHERGKEGIWCVQGMSLERGVSADLNRAICECVAKMERFKRG